MRIIISSVINVVVSLIAVCVRACLLTKAIAQWHVH